jgi:hypothetical protein
MPKPAKAHAHGNKYLLSNSLRFLDSSAVSRLQATAPLPF